MVTSNYRVYVKQFKPKKSTKDEPRLNKQAFKRYYALYEDREESDRKTNQFSSVKIDCSQREYGWEEDEYFEEEKDRTKGLDSKLLEELSQLRNAVKESSRTKEEDIKPKEKTLNKKEQEALRLVHDFKVLQILERFL